MECRSQYVNENQDVNHPSLVIYVLLFESRALDRNRVSKITIIVDVSVFVSNEITTHGVASMMDTRIHLLIRS